ncbi:restriction endonuclease subunit S [Candidatus Poriferisocius sp.]|uniref:restriction endonuclease subunit S n=1 Tax=Candidatus Poriferisocius sp. TaxID=3101276 RepID=UPI003B01764E
MTGELMPGWTWAAIEDLISEGGIFTDGDWVESKDQDPLGDVRLIQLADVGVGEFRDRSDRHLTIAKAAELNCTYLEPGDVLVARMPDPLGRACMFPNHLGKCVTVVDVAIARPGTGSVDPSWLMWSINSSQTNSQINELQSGTTRKRISRRNLAQVKLAVPPLAEQRRIVTAIEEHFSRLDAVDSAVDAAQQKLVAFRSSSFDQLFDKPNWTWTTLGQIAEVKGGVTKDSKNQGNPTFIEVPYLRVANVQRGYFNLDEVTTIRVNPEKAARLKLQPGDILFNEGGDRDKLGRGWVWEGQIEDCIHQNHVFRARLTSRAFDPYFVSMHGNSWGQRWFETHGKQTTNLASLNLTTLNSSAGSVFG